MGVPPTPQKNAENKRGLVRDAQEMRGAWASSFSFFYLLEAPDRAKEELPKRITKIVVHFKYLHFKCYAFFALKLKEPHTLRHC